MPRFSLRRKRSSKSSKGDKFASVKDHEYGAHDSDALDTSPPAGNAAVGNSSSSMIQPESPSVVATKPSPRSPALIHGDSVDEDEAKRAAEKIQAHIRGVKARTQAIFMQKKRRSMDIAAMPQSTQSALDKAATALQARMRGWKVRKADGKKIDAAKVIQARIRHLSVAGWSKAAVLGTTSFIARSPRYALRKTKRWLSSTKYGVLTGFTDWGMNKFYVGSVKPGLGGMDLPWRVRCVLHDLSDLVFEELTTEVQRALKMPEDIEDELGKYQISEGEISPSNLYEKRHSFLGGWVGDGEPPPSSRTSRKSGGSITAKTSASAAAAAAAAVTSPPPSPPVSPPSPGGGGFDGLGRLPWVATVLRFLSWVRLPMAMVEVTVKVNRARGLFNADASRTARLLRVRDLSDPYAKVRFGRRTYRSKTIDDSLDPEWEDASFTCKARMMAFQSEPLHIEIFDEDSIASADDSLGFADIEREVFDSLCMEALEAGRPAAKPFKLDLSLQGHVELDIHVASVEEATWKDWFEMQFDFLLTPARQMKRDLAAAKAKLQGEAGRKPEKLKRLHEERTVVRVGVRVVRATGLMNADEPDGVSDPYVVVRWVEREHRTRTVTADLNPVFDRATSTFSYHELRRDLQKEPLAVLVYGHDPLGEDDDLGYANVSIEELTAIIDTGVTTKPRTITKALSTQGSVTLEVEVQLKQPPRRMKQLRLLYEELVRPLLMSARAFLLYHRVPYDKTLFAKLRTWQYFVIVMIASSTHNLVRGAFFTLYLLAIARELEENQLVRFIMALKGFQFVSGLVGLVEVCFTFWQCTVIFAHGEAGHACEIYGPGTKSGGYVFESILLQLWMQLLLYVVFLLLPFSGKFNHTSQRMTYERGRMLWDEARAAIHKEAINRNRARRKTRSVQGEGGSSVLGLLKGVVSQGYHYDRLIDDAEIDQLIVEDRIGMPPSELLVADAADAELEELSTEDRTTAEQLDSQLRKTMRQGGIMKARARASMLGNLLFDWPSALPSAKKERMKFDVRVVADLTLALDLDEESGHRACARPFQLTGPEEAIKHLERFAIPDKSGVASLNGILSPMNEITIHGDAERKAKGIPLDAKYFAFAYPLRIDPEAGSLNVHFAALEEMPTWLDFALVGGFVYLNETLDIVRANALCVVAEGLAFKEPPQGKFELEGPFPAPPQAGKWLQEQGRLAPLTLGTFDGFHSFGWAHPGEPLGGRTLGKAALAFGAFVYAKGNDEYFYYGLAVDARSDAHGHDGSGGSDSSWDAQRRSLMRHLNYRYSVLRYWWRMVLYPQREGGCAASSHRLYWLLLWDARCLMFVGVIFLAMLVSAADASMRELHPSTESFATSSIKTLWYIPSIALRLVTPSFWEDWRVEISFSVCKLVFSLSTAPFTLLLIGFINKLFTHADATAYNQHGELTSASPGGCSAYLRFMRQDVQEAPRFKMELKEEFSEAERNRLEQALKRGEADLEEAWARRRNFRQQSAKIKKGVIDEVRKIITPAKASEALYRQCFPNEVLTTEYVARQKKKKEIEARDAAQAAKKSA